MEGAGRRTLSNSSSRPSASSASGCSKHTLPFHIKNNNDRCNINSISVVWWLNNKILITSTQDEIWHLQTRQVTPDKLQPLTFLDYFSVGTNVVLMFRWKRSERTWMAGVNLSQVHTTQLSESTRHASVPRAWPHMHTTHLSSRVVWTAGAWVFTLQDSSEMGVFTLCSSLLQEAWLTASKPSVLDFVKYISPTKCYSGIHSLKNTIIFFFKHIFLLTQNNYVQLKKIQITKKTRGENYIIPSVEWAKGADWRAQELKGGRT